MDKLGFGEGRRDWKSRRERWEQMRKDAPDTTCEIMWATCEKIISVAHTLKFNDATLQCRCIPKAKAEYEARVAAKELSRKRGLFGWLEPQPSMTFETFRMRSHWSLDQRRSAEHAKAVCEAYASNAQKRPFLTMFGNAGTGKTHLALAIAQSCGLEPLFAVSPDMLAFLRHTFSSENDLVYYAEFERLKYCDMLILDDLMAEYRRGGSDVSWAEEQLYELLSHRHWKKLPTVLTSNANILSATGRIGSRLNDDKVGQVILLDLPDNRRKVLVR